MSSSDGELPARVRSAKETFLMERVGHESSDRDGMRGRYLRVGVFSEKIVSNAISQEIRVSKNGSSWRIGFEVSGNIFSLLELERRVEDLSLTTIPQTQYF